MSNADSLRGDVCGLAETRAEESMRKNLTAYRDANRSFRMRFPQVARRMDDAIRRVGIDPVVGDLAGRHLLCAEALLDTLSKVLAKGPVRPSVEAVVEDYFSLVPDKVLTFEQRSIKEQKAVERAFPSVSVRLITVAFKNGLVDRAEIAGAVHEPEVYAQLVRRLKKAGIAPTPSRQR